MVSKRIFPVWVALMLAGLSMFILALAEPANAQADKNDDPSQCHSCHENLYALHDTGMWYCQCGTRTACISCHGGNPEATKAEEAHLNMVANPLTEPAKNCGSCHPDDFRERAERFAKISGRDVTTRISLQEYTPNEASLHTKFPESPRTDFSNPWVAGSLAAGVLVFTGLCTAFGKKCLKR